jgi:hypothetical protein
MSALPKLKIVKWNGDEVVQKIEEWKDFPFAIDDLVMVEGQEIYSYQELLAMASKEPFKNYEFLDVRVMPFIAGG